MLKTPVSVLQELTAQKRLAIPDYDAEGTGQPHCMSFTCRVKTGNYSAVGVGNTKKEAKHDAAKNMLKFFGVDMENKPEVSPLCLFPSKPSKFEGPQINYVGKLNEFASGHRHPQPTYVDHLTAQNGKFCIICTFNEFETKGYGLNKKDAKQDSAKMMLALIQDKDVGDNPVEAPTRKLEEDNEISEQVLKKYTELMRNVNLNENKNHNNNGETLIKDEVNISTWEDLTELLERQGYAYELSTFQRYPLMLSLKINECVLMNVGNSRQEILKKFVVNVDNMIRQGIDFSKPLLEL